VGGDYGHTGIEGVPEQPGTVEFLRRSVKGRDGGLGTDVTEQREIGYCQPAKNRKTFGAGQIDLMGGRDPFAEHGPVLQTVIELSFPIRPIRVHGGPEENPAVLFGERCHISIGDIEVRPLPLAILIVDIPAFVIDLVHSQQDALVDVSGFVDDSEEMLFYVTDIKLPKKAIGHKPEGKERDAAFELLRPIAPAFRIFLCPDMDMSVNDRAVHFRLLLTFVLGYGVNPRNSRKMRARKDVLLHRPLPARFGLYPLFAYIYRSRGNACQGDRIVSLVIMGEIILAEIAVLVATGRRADREEGVSPSFAINCQVLSLARISASRRFPKIERSGRLPGRAVHLTSLISAPEISMPVSAQSYLQHPVLK